MRLSEKVPASGGIEKGAFYKIVSEKSLGLSGTTSTDKLSLHPDVQKCLRYFLQPVAEGDFRR
ncbi:MAG: hypothetical protein RL386_2043 [Bacteroidota bacterium]|jgi:hypothetical protein